MHIEHSKKDIRLHVLIIVVFLVLPFLFTIGKPFAFSAFTKRDFLSNVLTVGFFYLNYLYLLPKFYMPKKYLTWISISFICYLAVAFIPQLVFIGSFENYSSGNKEQSFVFYIYETLTKVIMALFISLYLYTQQRFKQAQRDKLETELTYLKSQINPHFLFNSINTIYSLTLEKSNQAPNAVLKLSGLMRYVIDDAKNKTVPLSDEIKYIKDYVSLQQLRSPKNVIIDFEVSGDTSNLQIAPLILINYLENAFKFGINPEDNSNIEIKIEIVKSIIHFKIKNNKVFTRNSSKKGIGLDNTNQRLKYLYPNKYMLEIIDNDNIFEVTLNIDLK